MYQEQKSPDHVGTNLGVRSFLHFSSSKLEHGLLQPKENKFSLRLSLKEVTLSTMVLNAGCKRQQIASSTSILTKPRMPALPPHGPSSECQFYLHIHQAQNPSPTSNTQQVQNPSSISTPTKPRQFTQRLSLWIWVLSCCPRRVWVSHCPLCGSEDHFDGHFMDISTFPRPESFCGGRACCLARNTYHAYCLQQKKLQMIQWPEGESS